VRSNVIGKPDGVHPMGRRIFLARRDQNGSALLPDHAAHQLGAESSGIFVVRRDTA